MPSPTDLRVGVEGIRAAAVSALDPIFESGLSPYEIRAILNEMLPSLIEQYGEAASAWAADWYDDYRLQQDVPGRFTARTAPLRDPGVPQLVAWATQPLDLEAPNLRVAQSLLGGGVERRISDAGRNAITGSSFADPQSEGWQRVGAGACAFCRMLIARGKVFRSERAARFASHDNCACAAVPVFGGQPLPVRPYEPTSRRVSDADRARVRKYLRDNPDA